MRLQKYKQRQFFLQLLYAKYYFKVELYYILIKILLKNKFLEKQNKALIYYYIVFLGKIYSIGFQKNLCLRTFTKRSVFKFFRLNRLSIIENASKLYFPGVKKSIW